MDGGGEDGSFLGWASHCEDITEGPTCAAGSLSNVLCVEGGALGAGEGALLRWKPRNKPIHWCALTPAADEDGPSRQMEPMEG